MGLHSRTIEEARKDEEAYQIYYALQSTPLLVLDPKTMDNPGNGHVMHMLGEYWLYTDNVDGYKILTTDDLDGLTLATEESLELAKAAEALIKKANLGPGGLLGSEGLDVYFDAGIRSIRLSDGHGSVIVDGFGDLEGVIDDWVQMAANNQ